MEKNWKRIQEFDRYLIDEYGNIFSTISNKLIKTHLDKYGYEVTTLRKNGKDYNVKVHRLVAKAFIENPYNKPQVNHKDCNRHNNYYKNLEWCDAKYNAKYAYLYGNSKNCIDNIPKNINNKQIAQCNRHGDVLYVYESAKMAAKLTKIHYSAITGCANNTPHCKTAGGFVWKYL